MNTDDLRLSFEEAEPQVLRMQAKLHQWATDSPDRRFSDLYNLVSDPAFLVVAWHRVRGKSRSAIRGSGWGETELHSLRRLDAR